MNFAEAFNRGYIEAQYLLWQGNPQAASVRMAVFFLPEWRLLEQNFKTVRKAKSSRQKVEILKHRYRDIGHVLAGLTP